MQAELKRKVICPLFLKIPHVSHLSFFLFSLFFFYCFWLAIASLSLLVSVWQSPCNSRTIFWGNSINKNGAGLEFIQLGSEAQLQCFHTSPVGNAVLNKAAGTRALGIAGIIWCFAFRIVTERWSLSVFCLFWLLFLIHSSKLNIEPVKFQIPSLFYFFSTYIFLRHN